MAPIDKIFDWLKKNWAEYLKVLVAILLVAGIVFGAIRMMRAPQSHWRMTAVEPVVKIENEGQIYVRDDCTVDEYRNVIGNLAKEIIRIKTEAAQNQIPQNKVAPK